MATTLRITSDCNYGCCDYNVTINGGSPSTTTIYTNSPSYLPPPARQENTGTAEAERAIAQATRASEDALSASMEADRKISSYLREQQTLRSATPPLNTTVSVNVEGENVKIYSNAANTTVNDEFVSTAASHRLARDSLSPSARSPPRPVTPANYAASSPRGNFYDNDPLFSPARSYGGASNSTIRINIY